MTMRAFGPGPCGVPKATLEKWERDINEAVAKASEAGAGISPPPSYALDPSYLDQRVLAAGLPVRRGRVLGWSPERGPRGSYRVQLADAQVWAEYPGVGFALGDDVGVYLDGLGAAWHASSRGVDDMLRDHDERMKRARDVVGEIALGGAPAPRPDAGMVRCGRCGGPAGYLGIRCERVGGCRTAEERVAAMAPVVMGRLDEQRYSADVWEVWATDACDEWAWVIGPGRNAKRYATRDLAIAAWREEMLRRERAKDGRS